MKIAVKYSTMKEIQYYENKKTVKQDLYIKLQCNCTLCGTSLELKFVPINDTEIKEEAFCQQCEIRTRVKVHTLQ